MKFAREEGHLPQAVLPAIGRIPPVLGYLQLGLAEYLARKASLNKNVLCGSLGTGQRFHYQLYTFNLKYDGEIIGDRPTFSL